MVVILKNNPDEAQLQSLIHWLETKNIQVTQSLGESNHILGLIGDTSRIDMDLIGALDIVESVRRIQEPYKKANRKFHPDDTVITVKGTTIGNGELALIAGPGAVENDEQMLQIAQAVKAAGATILRGGAFIGRSSPYSFQGLGKEGLDALVKAGIATGMPVISEIMRISQLDYFKDVDIIQVGARNMKNFDLLKELGKSDKPILLKRGLSATYEELLMSAEYVMSQGNTNVILCERGIRTFETYTTNTFDISTIPVLKSLSHLPVVADPCHASGRAALVAPLAAASVAAGADGLMIEVHPDPTHALSDAKQQISPAAFADLAETLKTIRNTVKPQ
ncbi:MAG: 3-deoxy-7-phosphoheptulonate synthase [Clostridia bacterium]|nr:3-deoxy-7-phosphoheptulonate synthase [Clostridia bacterium]MBQ8926252.1 3-deoxy-7-phosphoheptulonate synthase [Clostridia bacterium]